jgi:hypothetical protein
MVIVLGIVATLLTGLPVRAPAQDTLPPACVRLRVSATVLDSIDAQLARMNPDWGATFGGRKVACILAQYDSVRLVAVALEGGDERTGGLAILTPDSNRILSVNPLGGARELISAGNRRLLVTYTYVRELLGAGQYESRYLVLCALSDDMWLPCLSVVRDGIQEVMATPRPMQFEEHNRAELKGSVLSVSREVRFQTWGAAQPRTERLGTVQLRLPSLP